MSGLKDFVFVGAGEPLVPEADGSEVKTLRQDRFTGVVFFPGGTIEPDHHHTHGDMTYVLEGEIHLTHVTTGKKYILKAGDYLYTPGGVSHHVHYVTDCKYLYINDGPFDGPFWDGPIKDVIKPNTTNKL
eukprot:TRINITY_DN3786_c0_g1_i1.p1 TRINITY_DN3786_c0_g1~~TRINITY_DN3786_c0_g1_i1.p1  ORF type:complete len:130 (-),score=30.18 TRINITY_DN3786_c0_g1_i1:46-435(-)